MEADAEVARAIIKAQLARDLVQNEDSVSRTFKLVSRFQGFWGERSVCGKGLVPPFMRGAC